jgi:hypothetical protein
METEKSNNENEKIKEKDTIKLNYDYRAYENIIINQKLKQSDSFRTKKKCNITLNNQKVTNNNIKKKEGKIKFLTEISLNDNKEVNNINNINSRYGLYKEFQSDQNKNETSNNQYSDQRYIQTVRNNVKQTSNLLKANMIENEFTKDLKRKDSLEKKLYLNNLLLDLNQEKNHRNINNKERKKSEESKDSEINELISKKTNKNNKIKNSNTMNDIINEEYLLTNDNFENEESDKIYITKENRKNLRNYKSNTQLNTALITKINELDSLENSEEKINKKNKNFVKKDKYDLLYKEFFNLKTKYEINKNNMSILEKKLKQKNYEISQMKKVLLSNNQQIKFLSALKDSNSKTIKDNEDLITTLKSTITNLNSKFIDYKNKLSFETNNDYHLIKAENESLKIYLNDRDKTISNLKNSLFFLTQNLDNILNISNYNESNEKIINECEQKIKLLKDQMNNKLTEFNIEKNNHNLEKQLSKIKIEYENVQKILEEKNNEIEKYKNDIKELNENINNINKENIEIKNENEKIKKNLEEKDMEIVRKNKEILEQKNKIIEENKKNILQIVPQSSFEFYPKLKKYETDIINKKINFEQNADNNLNDIFNIKEYSISSDKITFDKNHKKNNQKDKYTFKKIKNNSNDSKIVNHLTKQLLFSNRNKNNKFRIKTNFDYFNNDINFENEPGKITKSLNNLNYRKYKSNKNFNTIIGNNLVANKTSNEDINKDCKIDKPRELKLHLINNNDEDIKNVRYSKPNKKLRKLSPNLLLTTSLMSISQNENIKSITYPEKSTSNFEYIYSLTDSKLIRFNLQQKKFEIIDMYDNTKGIFSSYLSYYRQNKLQPLLLNTPKYFYILMQKHIFIYENISNNINILTKTFSNHLNGKFIQIENCLYLISGNNNTQCELYSLIMNGNKLLPSTNIPRINSGICSINDEYIYLFFGQFCENSIERLNIKNLNYNEKWEMIKINDISGINNNCSFCLNKFICFLDDYNNVIIFGGQDYNNEKNNKNIFGFNLEDNSLSIIGKIDSCSFYVNQHIQLDESIFSVFDENNGLHFFSKELDYHEIFNLNI